MSDPGPGSTGDPGQRADRGRRGRWHHGSVEIEDRFGRDMRRRIRAGQRREWQRERRLGIRRQGFGCLFGFVFLVVVASILATLATLISQIGPLQFVIVLIVAIALLAALLRGLFGAGRDLDRLLVATRRVEDGDYAVRLGGTRSDLRPIQELAHGFDTMVARLEADEEQRRSLLADVSHELRTPLTVITGNLEAIIDGIYPADTAHLGPILDETRVLERLIDDLRTVALSEAGTLPLHPEPTDIDLLLGDVARSFRPAAEAAGVELTTDAPADLPIIDVDPVRIREVIANLVANALRHTPSGGAIAVRASATGGSVVLTVSDTGPGIDPALLPHVFDRFVRGETSGGSGLGLAIARGLVEAHGGRISVASSDSSGTTFQVELPGPAAADA